MWHTRVVGGDMAVWSVAKGLALGVVALAALLAGVFAELSDAPMFEAHMNMRGETANTGAARRAVSEWELGGDAALADGTAPTPWSVVRLSADKQSQRGWAFTRKPLDTLGFDWQIDVEYRIHGKGMTYYGDGFALWYTPERFTEGKGGASCCCGDVLNNSAPGVDIHALRCPLLPSVWPRVRVYWVRPLL